MQIKFKQGMTIDDMISALQTLKEQELEDYNVLKNDATLYINLKNDNNLICPKNELEFYANINGQIIDVIASLKEKANNECYESLIRYLKYKLMEEEELFSSLNKAQKLLEKAKVKKTKTIEKWELEIKHLNDEISTIQKIKPTLEAIYNTINKENVNFHSIVHKEKGKYKNTIYIGVCITFKHNDETILYAKDSNGDLQLYVVDDVNNIPLSCYIFYK